MTYEITDRKDFAEKFAYLMAANMDLINSGFPPSAELSEKMINEFLNQFIVATPAPAIPKTAGFIIIANMTGWLTGNFRERLFENEADALLAIDDWVKETGQGKASAYGVRRVTYFG